MSSSVGYTADRVATEASSSLTVVRNLIGGEWVESPGSPRLNVYAELDGIEIGAVGRQIPQRHAGCLERMLDTGDLVRAEIIGDDDVAGVQRRHQDLFDVGQEAGPVHRTVEDARRGQAGDPQRREKRAGLPPRTRSVILDAGPA